MLWPFCKEYGLVCAEVHFCQDALGFHGALDERDHTELSGEWQAVLEKAAGNEHDMMDLKKKNRGGKKEEETARHTEYEPQRWVTRKLGDPLTKNKCVHKSLLCNPPENTTVWFILHFLASFFPVTSCVNTQCLERHSHTFLHGQDAGHDAFANHAQFPQSVLFRNDVQLNAVSVFLCYCKLWLYLLEWKAFFFPSSLQSVTC